MLITFNRYYYYNIPALNDFGVAYHITRKRNGFGPLSKLLWVASIQDMTDPAFYFLKWCLSTLVPSFKSTAYRSSSKVGLSFIHTGPFFKMKHFREAMNIYAVGLVGTECKSTSVNTTVSKNFFEKVIHHRINENFCI